MKAAAERLIAVRAADGATPAETWLPGSTEPGVWQPTPPAFGPGILLHWRNLTPFGIKSGDQFRSYPPPSLTSWRYGAGTMRMKRSGRGTAQRDRPQDRTDVARFFAVASAVQCVELRAPASERRARAIARAECARVRAHQHGDQRRARLIHGDQILYQFWRPVTAHRGGARVDGNHLTDSDPAWLPLVTTPAFPSYPSAHASASYAARLVAESLFGPWHARFDLSHPACPGCCSAIRRSSS